MALTDAPVPAQEIPSNFMWNACVRAWHQIAKRIEEQHPGWAVIYTDRGFYARRQRDSLQMGPATWNGIEALISVADAPPLSLPPRF